MSDVTNIGAELPAHDAAENALGLSLLQKAEKKRKDREKSLFLDVPSWDGDVIAEYRIVGPDGLTKIAERTVKRMRDGGTALDNDIDLLITSCTGLHARDPESGARVPIEDEYGIVDYSRIAHVLGKDDEIKTAADAVRYMTSEREEDGTWKENTVAIGTHANEVSRWMRDPSKRQMSIEDLLGGA